MFSSRTSNHNHHQHHHHPNHHPHRGPPRTGDGGGSPVSIESAMATDIFEQFVAASTFKSVLHHFRHMCDVLKLRPQNIRNFYPKLRSKIRSWKAQAIWSKFDKRMSPKCYNHGKACSNTKVLIIGAGPCGLRSAIEAQLLGAKVVVIEKRDRFSRNNVLHLWPFVIADLKALGAKKFYGKFCAGAIDHISIRQLQCMLLKAALLLGVEVFEAVTFEQLLEPPEDQSQTKGWHAQFSPSDHPVNQYEFDVLIGADGKRNTLLGFKRKEFRGKLAIAITANFINKHTELEARVQEISGVAFIFNQKFFKDLYADTGIDLENIVYYKDDTHYFVMTAKKHSLINKGVILRDLPDTQQLLHPNNVDRKALCDYAREAADFSTGYQLPHLDFAVNHYGKPDIAMFDFTSMFAAENACRVVRKNGHSILQCLVGDSLLEPFWPTGSGCARGFLSCFDACWAIRSWGSEEMTPLEVVAERESVYRLLAQTTPENLSKDFSSYTVQPSSRYPTVNTKSLLPFQVCHLYVTDDPDDDGGLNSVDDALSSPLRESADVDAPRKRKRKDSRIQPDAFLSWCQKQVEHNEQIKIEDFDSFKDGRILCTILHRYRPDLVDVDNLDHISCSQRCQLAFNVLEKEFGIKPIMSGSEMVEMNSEERLNVASYISQIHDALRGEIPRVMGSNPPFKVHKGQSNFDDFEDFPVTNDEKSVNDNHHCTSLAHRGREHVERATKEDGISLTKEGGLQQKRKHRSNSSLDKLEDEKSKEKVPNNKSTSFGDRAEDFSDKVKGLEAKFRGTARSPNSTQQRPKDLMRAVGKLEKTDWNLCAIEKKIKDNMKPVVSTDVRERVPKWSQDVYNDKYQNIERRLRENGENEERIAKYLDIDASLKRLERKLREGSTLETGLRGNNKVSNLASQLSSKLTRKESESSTNKTAGSGPKQTKQMVLPTGTSDLCYFCGTRVYLVERLCTEGKYFHRQCFKCNYCGAFLRLGNYIYDRENRYGGKFFCIPHFGLTVKPKSPNGLAQFSSKVGSETASSSIRKDARRSNSLIASLTPGKEKNLMSNCDLLSPSIKMDISLDRGDTPERVEFENSVVEHSDEEEYLSEDEWTDRNFGASANELDDDDSDYSDLSDDEIDENALFLDAPIPMSADETRRLAETWKIRYSTDGDRPRDRSFSESDLGEMSEHGVEGDESFIPTEGEIGDDDDDDQDDEHARLARELRRQELNINVSAPPRVVGETSDSESDTEIGSESESDTQIDTDSEFEEDNQFNRGQIPKIVIDEMPKEVAASTAPGAGTSAALSCSQQEDANEPAAKNLDEVGYPKSQYISQVVELNSTNLKDADSTPQSDGLSNLALGKQVQAPNPHSEHLKRLLQRTESTEAFSAQRSILKREYLLGNASSAPKKSVSSTDLGNRFKSFMDKISETQKKLNPAPEPSPSMQAFLNLSTKNNQAMTYKSESFSFNKTSPFLRSSLSAASMKQESCFEKREENSGVIDEHAAASLSSSSEKSDDEGKLITFSSTGGSSVGKNGNIIREQRISKLSQSSPSSSSFNEDATTIDLKGEKGALDSAQSEKTSNSAISERIEGVNESNLDDCFGERLKMKDFSDQENNVEALNLQLVSSENIRNSECSTEISSSNCAVNVPNDFEVGEIEGIFDKLAEEAINALEVESFSPTILEDTSEEDQKGTCRPNSVEDELHIAENKTNLSENENFIVEKSGSFELKSSQGESSSQSDCFGLSNKDKTTDESGFKSIEDNKGDLSDTEQCLLVQDDCSKKDSEATLSTNSVTLKNSEKFAARTEADLSDWAEDSDAAVSGTLKTPESESSLRSPSALNDLLTLNPFSGSTKGSNMNLELNIVPRFASQESLGDSDSAISLGLVKTSFVSSTSKLAAFAESEDFEYADLSTNEASPDGGQTTIEYKKLENDSPCSPIQTSDFTNDKHTAPTASASNMSVKGGEFKDHQSSKTPHMCRSDEAFSESLIKDPLKSPGRYEGYFPRFKDGKAFNFVRDSIDVRKRSSVKPLFTPSKEDILQREENEKRRMNFFASDASPSPPSISSSSSTSVGSCAPKNKVGDVVKDMVLSRMNSKNLDKDRRRSRSAISPLRQGSNSSLVTPESDIHTSKLNSPKEGFSPLKMQQFSLYSASKDSSSSLGGEFNNNTDGNSENILSRSPSDVKMRDTCGNVFSVNFKASDQFKSGIGIENRNFYKSSPQLHLSTSHQLSTSPNFEPHSETFVSEIPVGSKIENSSKTCSSNPFNRRLSEGELRRPSILTVVGDGFSNNAKPQGFGRVKKDPNERLKELLEERRRKGQGDESKEAKLRNKNFCLKECLEEYRQKRCSAPVFPPEPPLVPTVAAESNQKDVLRAKLNLPLGERYYNRPSLLELESMQIFSCNSNRSLREKPSTNTQDANRPRASSFSWNKTPSNAGHATTHNAIPPSSLYPDSLSSSLANPNEEQTTTGLSTVSSKNNHEMTPSDQHTAAKGTQLYFHTSQDAASTPTGQKRSKKKDRERRRSLIQFVAGLFSKSDEKERDAPEADNIESNSSSPKERTKSRSSTHEAPVTPSTSPDSGPTMKGRLSKFRLSRSKERRKEESVELKSRSASVGSHLSCEMSLEPSAASSLPSTPSRSLFSFLSTSPEKIKRPSPSGLSANYFAMKFSPACIKEEKDSEDDSPLASVTAKQSSASSSISTPSQRRQKAAQRAAKQAEQKRLRMAQEVQRQMEECEVKMRELEEKGIAVEKSLIGETKEGSLDEMLLMKEWFSLVREKNSLVRSQDQLGIKARELELEDRHVRLENELRQRMTSSEREKTREDIDREGTILTEIIAIIDEKDTLDTLLEDDRQRYAEEDRDLEQIYARKFSSLHKNAEKETGV